MIYGGRANSEKRIVFIACLRKNNKIFLRKENSFSAGKYFPDEGNPAEIFPPPNNIIILLEKRAFLDFLM